MGADGIFVFWPMEYELVRSRFRANLLGATKGLWESVVDAGRAYAALDVAEPTGENGGRSVAALGRDDEDVPGPELAQGTPAAGNAGHDRVSGHLCTWQLDGASPCLTCRTSLDASAWAGSAG